jgi:hypothetical protein
LETCDAYYTIEEADQEAKRWSSWRLKIALRMGHWKFNSYCNKVECSIRYNGGNPDLSRLPKPARIRQGDCLGWRREEDGSIVVSVIKRDVPCVHCSHVVVGIRRAFRKLSTIRLVAAAMSRPLLKERPGMAICPIYFTNT